VQDLASSWCSAYRGSDPERLAALETREIEIVDRFGEWHHLIGLKARVHFWEDGFDMAGLKDFRPACIGRGRPSESLLRRGNRTEEWRPHSAIFRNSYFGPRQGPRHVANYDAEHRATEFPG
jgi:hypothetical protein